MAGITAALISYNGLVRTFGNSNEKLGGVMYVADTNDWLARLSNAPTGFWGLTGKPVKPSDGTTGEVAKEWWAVWNYLQYNSGACIVGGTGSASFTTIGTTYTPLHSSSEKINVFFGGGNTLSNTAAADAATVRGDAFAVVGALKGITQPVSALFTMHQIDFGVTGFTGSAVSSGTTGNNVIYVAGRKNFFLDYASTGVTDVDKIDLASDIAGCIGKTTINYNSWTTPAGFKKGAINGVLTLEQAFSSTESDYLQNSGVNPVITYPGKGTYFMGNSTGAAAAGSTFSRGYMNVVAIVNYVKSEIKGLANEYLFEPNTDNNRSSFITRASSILDGVKSSGSISAFSVICPPADNTGITFTAEIRLTPVNVAEAITLKVINNTTSEVITV